jgi:hypothetical protein
MAQTSFGIKGGAVLSTLRRDANLNVNGGRVGYLLGIFVKKNMGDLGWFFQPEVQYATEGDNGQKLAYLRVPLLLGLDLSEDVNLHLAYQPSILIGGENDARDFLKTWNHVISMGMEFTAIKNGLIGTRINYGATNIVEVPAEAKNYTIRTFTVDVYLALFLRKNGKSE